MNIDINCDVGEGIENEYLLMPYISSCNVACGGHFGDANSIDRTIELAVKNNVLIGAHPSFPDKDNFGRKIIQISNEDLNTSIKNQLDVFLQRMRGFHQKMHHIKPHGALYNLIAVDKVAALHFIESIKDYTDGVFLYVPYNSVIAKVAKQNNIAVKYEAFTDRSYNNDLSLVARSHNKALLTDKEEVYNHVYKMIDKGVVKTISGLEKKIIADTFCVHGDNIASLELLNYLHSKFIDNGITVGQ